MAPSPTVQIVDISSRFKSLDNWAIVGKDFIFVQQLVTSHWSVCVRHISVPIALSLCFMVCKNVCCLWCTGIKIWKEIFSWLSSIFLQVVKIHWSPDQTWQETKALLASFLNCVRFGKRQHVDGLHVARVIKNWRITTNCAGCVTSTCNWKPASHLSHFEASMLLPVCHASRNNGSEQI